MWLQGAKWRKGQARQRYLVYLKKLWKKLYFPPAEQKCASRKIRGRQMEGDELRKGELSGLGSPKRGKPGANQPDISRGTALHQDL